MHCKIDLPDEAATRRLAVAIGGRLAPGDCLLLSGPVGAGKSFFARCLIRHLCGAAEDVPSPSFTLMQTYSAGAVEICHIDLYRLSGAQALAELGLDDAFESSIALVEWPERLGSLTPARHLLIELLGHPNDENRRTAMVTPSGKWPRLADLFDTWQRPA